MGYVRLQKDNFRKQLLSLPQQQFKVLALPAEALFKNKAGFEWKEKNKELVINGHYYEVVTYTVTNGIANVTLLADEAETNLFSVYFSHLHNHKNSHWHLLLSLLSVQLIDSTSKFSFTKRIAESLLYKTIELDLSEGCGPKILLPPKVS